MRHGGRTEDFFGNPRSSRRLRLNATRQSPEEASASPASNYDPRISRPLEPAMSLEPLVLDLIEWIAKEPRTYAEVMEAWRTSCPKLAVWEEAIDRGFVERSAVGGRSFVLVTKRGEAFLRAN